MKETDGPMLTLHTTTEHQALVVAASVEPIAVAPHAVAGIPAYGMCNASDRLRTDDRRTPSFVFGTWKNRPRRLVGYVT